MDAKIKHLEFIQEAIKRMAGNSFLLRGWSITLIIAIVTLAHQSNKPVYFIVALLINLIFWLLDSYYLLQEKKFRCLYDEVRKKDQTQIDFSMKLPDNHCKKCKWQSSLKSTVFIIFYGITTAILVAVVLLNYFIITVNIK